MKKQNSKHHFLYYIFQSDKKRCIMEEKQWFLIRQLLRAFSKGDAYYGKREIGQLGSQSPDR